MTFFANDSFSSDEGFYLRDNGGSESSPASRTGREDFHILTEKLLIPQFDDILQRPRLDDMIEKSVTQFAATLISGRSGTGKTALAADFANNRRKVAWYSVESPDVEWNVFSRYFSASLSRALESDENMSVPENEKLVVSKGAIASFLADVFAKIDSASDQEPILLVLDDLHHIFDAPWFSEFFNILLHSLRENTHLLLTCRSRPPGPLWRMRSKQMLNVIDEKLLAFNSDETIAFFKRAGLPEKTAPKAHADSFGRIAKVKQIASRLPTVEYP